MNIEDRLDRLIDAGWQVLASDFSPVVFQSWRREAYDCLNGLLGPEHTYTQYFEDFVKKQDELTILTGEGILTAAKEQITKPHLEGGKICGITGCI